MSDRYAGRAWTKVVDSYVLDLLGALDEQTDERLLAMTPKFQQVFNQPGATWREIVRAQMEFDDDYDQWLRSKWQEQLAHDDRIGQAHDPVAWSYAMVDMITADR
ncbi:MAG: hypothetical protein ACK5OX_06010 [Desertimonas sp.]